jgi:hypothetical protein
MFGDCNCSDCPIPLYGNNVTPPIMYHFSILRSWSLQQHGITKIYHTILKHNKCSYIKNVVNIYLHIFNQTHWFCGYLIYHLQIRLTLRIKSPTLNLNYSMMILTLVPSSSNTSFIVFFSIYTWIIAM